MQGPRSEDLSAGVVVEGPILPEPVEVITTVPMGSSIKLVGRGLHSGQVRDPILDAEQLAQLTLTPKELPFDGDARRFKFGIEAARLGLAYEYDPYFSLSIARVDPLPHQLEAVYDYFLKLPRIRFLLADDPGAGKTIMAGLLLKELKIRGLVKRTLIVAPANLTFQWQREMKDKFREQFDVMRGEVLRTQYGQNPWQERNQVVASVSWISRVEDAKESLLRSSWDLVVVDEAHKMSAYSADKKTLAFQIGESLSQRTDHFLLMTATPHKGDPENFRLFLSLLDRDVYGDVKSLEEAMRRQEAPFYLRRLKEALVAFPDPESGDVKKLAAASQGWGDVGAPTAGETTLDCVHQAMLLFAAGRAEAMKRFLVEEGVGRQSRFWKLAQSLSALYPPGTNEKRWVDGVLARKKGLGFG